MVKVYVDNFMSLVFPVSQEQLRHIVNAIMHGIHDVFPPDNNDNEDPISETKMKKGKGLYDIKKTLLGFDFDGDAKTMWLESAKQEKLLTIFKGWIRTGKQGSVEILFSDYELTILKIPHAFKSIPAGYGLLLPCNRVFKNPLYVYLQRDAAVLTALEGCQTLLCESTKEPTQCRELVSGWPDYIRIVDASGHGVGGVVLGELSQCTPVVFRWEWPADIKQNLISFSNPTGGITNSNLEMEGLLMLWLVLKGVCPTLRKKCVTLFSDNSPTVSWVTWLASCRSVVAEHLVQALTLWLKTMHTCPLTPLHIEGKRNAIANVPPWLFGSNRAWTCASDTDLLNLFNTLFPLPQQKSWTVYHPNCTVVTCVISALRMKPFALDDWRQLPTSGRCVGETGAPMSNT
jgi:hypothetical protein